MNNTTTPIIQMVNKQENPEKYKDIFINFLQAIIEANKSKTTMGKNGARTTEGSIDQKITSYKDFIRIAQAILPEKIYERNRLEKLKPNYRNFELDYFTRYPPLVNEMKVREIPIIRQLWKEEYLDKLQTEFGFVIDKVYEYKGWNFDEVIKTTYGK
jgi:hypothetical protein